VKAEYLSTEEEVSQPVLAAQGSSPSIVATKELSMSEAIEAIRSEDYDDAILFFEKLTHDRPTYHIGWLRLGYARREKAVRLDSDNLEEAIRLLTLALDDLSKATQHIDPQYKALAWYERSKTSYHLARLVPEKEQYAKVCVHDAERAFSFSDEKKFLTWWEHIQTWAPSAFTAAAAS
jgi:tetratricopeptide (TPR) repeat protein